MSRMPRRTAAAAMLAALVAVPAAAPALAQGEAVEITHRQSVQTELSPTGDAGTSRVFTQLGVTGDGDVEVVLPDQATRGLRNLGGLGRPQTDGDAVLWNVSATEDGTLQRTVADNTSPLPVSFDITYELDGEVVEPDDVAGRSGELTVTYLVRNTTAEPTELTVVDGDNNKTQETVDVAVPMVGTLALTLDERFADVVAAGAAVAGDGRGNTAVNWSLVLFSPLGDEEQTVSWTAHVSDAVVPEATARIVPVTSESFASLQSTKEAYAGAVASTTALATSAGLIDTNMQRLVRGSSDLLDGLVQLRDGSRELAEGLNESAVPGSRELADGTGQARSGANELADGLGGTAAPGARQLASGTGAARAGASELAAGLSNEAAPGAGELAAGLRDSAVPGARELRGGIQGLSGGVGQRGQTAGDGTLIGGLSSLRGGVAQGVLNGIGLVRLQQANGAGCGFTSPDEVAACGMREIGLRLAGSLGGLGDALSGALEDQLQAGLESGLEENLAPNLEAALSGALGTNLGDALEENVTPALLAALGDGLGDGLEDALQNQLAPRLIASLEDGLAEGLEETLEEQLTGALTSQVAPQLVATLETQLAAGLRRELSGNLEAALATQLAAGMEGPLTAFLRDQVGVEEGAGALAAGFAQGFAPGFASQFAGAFADGFASEFAAGFGDAVEDQIATALSGFAGQFAATLAPQFASGFAEEFAAQAGPALGQFADAFAEGFVAEIAPALDGFGEAFAGQFSPAFSAQLAAGFADQFSAGFIEQLGPGLAEFGAGFDEAAFGPLAALAGAVVAKAEGSAAGLDEIAAGIRGEVLPGFDQLLGGLSNPLCDRGNPTNPANPCGVREVLQLLDSGAGALVIGLGDAAGGAGELAAGLRVAATGSRELAAGLGQIDDGASRLADGLGDAASGSRELAAGLGQIDDGANQLADGLGDAGDGSEQIADGLGQASDGGEQLAEGTAQLQEIGTQALAEGVSAATADSSLLLEHAKATDERGIAGDGLPYGTVEGATASAVYQYEIAGVGSEDGPSGPVRAAGALLGFGALGALGLGVRRRLV